MGASPQFTEAMIQGYIADHRGQRFVSAQLALIFGGGQKAMTETLNNMARQEKIRRASDGKRSFFYLPSDEQVAQESNAHRARPFKALSSSSLPCLDYERRRAGSSDMLKVPSKHV